MFKPNERTMYIIYAQKTITPIMIRSNKKTDFLKNTVQQEKVFALHQVYDIGFR